MMRATFELGPFRWVAQLTREDTGHSPEPTHELQGDVYSQVERAPEHHIGFGCRLDEGGDQ